MWFVRLAFMSALALGLAGCATGPRIVSSQVRTSAAQPPGAAVLPGVHYRFEPIPTVAGQPAPGQLEALAQTALARVGAVRDDAHARVGVQVTGTANVYWSDSWGAPYDEPSNARIALGMGYGWSGSGWGLGLGWPMWNDTVPIYVSEVTLVMRDLQSGQIVYDTRARHDGTWSNTDAVLTALFAAALQGYPDPPPGARRVDVPLLPVAQPSAR